MPRLGFGLGLSRFRSGGGSAPAVPILDTVTGAAGAYSTRLLRTAYAGSAIRVRESGGNTEADIGFDSNGDLDTAALLSHCGSNSGFVVTWYDQGENARDVTQATTTRQPRIVNAGAIETLNSKPAVRWDGTDDVLSNASAFLYAAGAATIFLVHNLAGSGPANVVFEGRSTNATPRYQIRRGTTSNIWHNIANDAGTAILNNASVTTDVAFDGTSRIIAIRDSGSQSQGFINGALGLEPTYTRSGAITLDRFALGGADNNGVQNGGPAGHIAEAIFFPSALSNADFNTVGASQGEEYGITVAPFLSASEQLAIINGTGDGGSSFATNLGGITDSDEHVFIDRAKQARGWRRLDFSATPAENLDSDGALASLPSGDTTQMFFFSAFRDANGENVGTPPDRSGRYRMTFTGSATVVGSGVTNLTQIDANTYEFDCDFILNKWFVFTPTSFPIKVAIVKTTDLAAHAAGAIFRQDWLDHLPSGGCYRFMDWMITNERNGSLPAVTSIAEYPASTSQKWARVPLSAIVSLCNAKSADPWINIGHKWPDDLVTAWAEYLRDNLDTDLLIRVELSNEIWNTGVFLQGAYFKALAESDWGVPDGYSNGIWLDRAGKRFVQIMQIFNTVFAGQTHRICGVIGGQAGGVGLASRMLDAPQWQTSEPGSYIAPYTLAKEWSIAPYINWTGGATAQGDNIKAQLDISHAAAVAYIKGMIPASLTQAYGWIDAHVPVAATRGLRLTIYEYNNHYDLVATDASSLYSGGVPVAGALDAFIEATYSQEMADGLDDLRDYFKAQNGSLMAIFNNMGRASVFGTWGAKTHIEHDSPIWNDLLTWHTANGRWWAQ